MSNQQRALLHKTLLLTPLQSLLPLLLIVAWPPSSVAHAQTSSNLSRVNIAVVSTSPPRIRIEIDTAVPTNVWSFPNAYAGVIGLGERIENVIGLAKDGATVQARRFAPGEFRTSVSVARVVYEVALAEPKRTANKSHLSWLNSTGGLLMMADLLPNGTGEVSIEVKPPEGWEFASIAPKEGDRFISLDANKVVFLLSSRLEKKLTRVESNDWLLASAEGWQLSEKDVRKAAEKIIKEYGKLTGFRIQKPFAVYLIPLPVAGADRWTAETRGNTVVLLMGQRGDRRELLARLKVILTHELFHLWVPGALDLSGDYDWFFEGFTLYQALRTTQRLGLVDFNEYLRTIGRVYDSYLIAPDRDNLSLLDLSQRRWTSSNSLVYDRGMLVAFLYDLQLRWLSGGNRAAADIYPRLFLGLRDRSPSTANDVIIDLLDSPDGMGQFSARYIKTTTPIDLESLLAPYGIEVKRENFKTQLSVSPDLNNEQRRLLKSLGYKS